MTEIIGRSEARDKGLSHYFTGKPCKHGHLSSRRTKDGSCNECQRSYSSNRKSWRENNKTKIAEIERWSKIKMTYGLARQNFEEMLLNQDNKCVICQEDFIKTPHVDHCHSSGQVRGLLCSPCNTGIGLLRDDPVLVDRAAAYLRHK